VNLLRVRARAAIEREELKVKKSIKDAAKRGDNATAKMFAKEVVRSRRMVGRLHMTKAQMNSVSMQMQNQLGAPPLPALSAPFPSPLPSPPSPPLSLCAHAPSGRAHLPSSPREPPRGDN
jgi:hypothetical protein